MNMAKSANICVEVDSELKQQAESVLERLGIPMSTAITMFLRQIVLRNGLPFNEQKPLRRPLVLSEMTSEQINKELEEAYQQVLRGECIPVDQAFDELRRKYNLKEVDAKQKDLP